MTDETVVATPDNEKPTRQEALAAAMDAAEQAPTADAPAAEEAEPIVEDRPRGPDGKFLAAQPVDEAAPVAEPVEEPVWKRPPASWGKTDHEKWLTAANNPDVAPFVQKAWEREEEMRRGVEPLIPKAKFADQLFEAIEPFKANIEAAGVTPLHAMTTLMFTEHQLRTLPPDQKKQYALGLMKQYGIEFTPEDAFAFASMPPPQPAPINVEAIVDRKLSALESQRQDDILQAEIDEFKKDKPDFEQLRPAMQAILAGGLVQDLASAYEKAKRLDDTAFAQMQTAHQADADAARREAADKAAKAAKAAAVSPRSSTPGARPATNAKDRRSTLSEQFDGITERF